ncbi:uncharacterized protein LOC135845896 [Planococcus citri]|uniref:uncharacterized protein LOC135845896 n=1 Tax=Planococcus citri TaxID=170843 RepID=UPI0031F9EAEB
MNLKLFSHLIMTHLLSEWCCVLGQDSEEAMNIDAMDQKLLDKVSTYAPNVYAAVRNRLVNKQIEFQQYRGEYRGKYDQKCQSHEAEKAKNDKNVAQLAVYAEVAQCIKIRDWIVDIEKNFPQWLSYLSVNRFIKWVLALKYAQGPVFDYLNRLLQASEVSIETFANEIHSLYEDMSASFAHKLPSSVPNPTRENIPKLCHLVAGNNKGRKTSCKVLLEAMFTPMDASSSKSIASSSTTPDPMPTKFYIIIAYYKNPMEESIVAINTLTKIVESNSEFKKEKCKVLEKFIIGPATIDNTQFGKQNRMNLPTIIIRVGFPKSLRGQSSTEFELYFSELQSLKKSIKADLTLPKPGKENSIPDILMPNEFISHKWFQSLTDPTQEQKPADENHISEEKSK